MNPISSRRDKNLISIVTPTFNEVGNVQELFERIRNVMVDLEHEYDYEHIVIDNSSTDGTRELLKELASRDKRLKLIINAGNFGHIKSPIHGMFQASGDAVILLSSDLQDPPENIPKFLELWTGGAKVVLAVKKSTSEGLLMRNIRKSYYRILGSISESPLVRDATGAGLFDRKVIEVIRAIDDPNPYFRGLVTELGFPIRTLPFDQPLRKSGRSKNNFYTLYDIGMLGLITHSRVPMRLIAFLGFLTGSISVLVALAYLLAKLVFWDTFSVGLAPLVIGVFFLGGFQIAFLGYLGEYLMAIQGRLRKLPLVIEHERINFTGKSEK